MFILFLIEEPEHIVAMTKLIIRRKSDLNPHHAFSLDVFDLLNRLNYVRPSVHQMKWTEEPYYLLLSNW